jgi:hypothetical protein
MAQGVPIDLRDPALLFRIPVNHTIREQIIRLPGVIRVIGVERQHQAIPKLDVLSGKVFLGSRAGQAQTVEIVEVLEVGIHAWM